MNDEIPRAFQLAAGFPLIAPAMVAFSDVNPVILWPALVALYGLSLLFFVWNVDSSKPWPRYFVFAIAYILAYRYWRNEWNRPPFIDGATAVGELGLGGLYWGTLAVVCLLI